MAEAAGVGRLVVTHVPPWHDPRTAHEEAIAEFGGPCEVAVPGARYQL
jgi:ribonuclease BN (tRNA processing enzyme)